MKKITCLLVMVLMLTSCGFQPIYGQKQQGNIARFLERVEIKVLDPKITNNAGISFLSNAERLRQQSKTSLEDSLNPRHIDTATTDYQLSVRPVINHDPAAIQRDTSITRYNITIVAEYTIQDKKTGKTLAQGRVVREGAYDAAESDYSTYVSAQDTVTRVLQVIAQDMKFKVTAALDEVTG